MFKPNLNEIENAQKQETIEIPYSRYPVEVLDYLPYKQGIRWKFRILRGDFAGRVVCMFTPLNGMGVRYLIRTIRAMDPGYDGAPFGDTTYLGRKLWVKIRKQNEEGTRSYYEVTPETLPDESPNLDQSSDNHHSDSEVRS